MWDVWRLEELKWPALHSPHILACAAYNQVIIEEQMSRLARHYEYDIGVLLVVGIFHLLRIPGGRMGDMSSHSLLSWRHQVASKNSIFELKLLVGGRELPLELMAGLVDWLLLGRLLWLLQYC